MLGFVYTAVVHKGLGPAAAALCRHGGADGPRLAGFTPRGELLFPARNISFRGSHCQISHASCHILSVKLQLTPSRLLSPNGSSYMRGPNHYHSASWQQIGQVGTCFCKASYMHPWQHYFNLCQSLSNISISSSAPSRLWTPAAACRKPGAFLLCLLDDACAQRTLRSPP